MKHLLFMVASILLYQCGSDGLLPSGKPTSYFNLKQFIYNDTLSKKDLTIRKKVMLNGKREEKDAKVKNWKRELAGFIQADINKPAFIGKYEVDTLYNGKKIQSIAYRAKDRDLKTRALTVYFNLNEHKPEHVDLEMSTKNILYRSNQHMTYNVNTGYFIEGMQKIKFLDPDTFTVRALF